MIHTLDLFSGIGGFSLGLERAGGFQTVAFCEIDPFCRKLLGRRWPGVRIYQDVEALTGDRLRADGLRVDCICGGFPCQDISVAGRGAGLAGGRSGLWWQYARIIDETKPEWVIIENVAVLRSRGLDVVLGTLFALGYDAEWHIISAAAVGAPHLRERVWIIAHAAGRGSRRDGLRLEQVLVGCSETLADASAPERRAGVAEGHDDNRQYGDHRIRPQSPDRSPQRGELGTDALADAAWDGGRSRLGTIASGEGGGRAFGFGTERQAGAYATSAGLPHGHGEQMEQPGKEPQPQRLARGSNGSDADSAGLEVGQTCNAGGTWPLCWPAIERNGWWAVEPAVGRVADGIPNRVDRLTALGNAVVPQIPELIGRAILACVPYGD